MKVFGWQSRKDQPLTSPFPIRNGVFFALRGGDVCGADNWANPTKMHRSYWWLPVRFFFSMKLGHFGFYVGPGKVFGVDTEKQKEYIGINPKEVYNGSLAMNTFTWRFTTNLP